VFTQADKEMPRQRQGASLRGTEENKIDGGRGGMVLYMAGPASS